MRNEKHKVIRIIATGISREDTTNKPKTVVSETHHAHPWIGHHVDGRKVVKLRLPTPQTPDQKRE